MKQKVAKKIVLLAMAMLLAGSANITVFAANNGKVQYATSSADTPKTGDDGAIVWILGATVIVAAGAVLTRRKANESMELPLEG